MILSALIFKLSALSCDQCAEFLSFTEKPHTTLFRTTADLQSLLVMSFNPGQLEVLQMLLNLSPEQRNCALQAVLVKDGAPMSPLVRRRPPTEDGYRTPGSDDSSITVAEDGGGSGKKRIHKKNRVTRLATKICQEYLNSQRVWRYLYNDSNRVVEHKFDNILDQVRKSLTYDEQKTMKTHREQLKKYLKKRMAAGKRYRSKQKLGSFQESHKSTTIDLTGDDDNEATVKKDDGSETPTEPSVSAKAKVEAKVEAKPKPEESKTRRERAKDFAKRMSDRRNEKKTRKQTKTDAKGKVSGEEVSGEAKSSGEPDTVAKTKSKKSPKPTKRKQVTPASAPQKKSRTRSQRKKKQSPTKSPVAFPLGTRVARDFDGVIYTGTITQLYDDTPHLCQVTYSDGDQEDLESGQVDYATQLFTRDYSGK